MANKKAVEASETVHTKAQLLASQKYAGKQDIINVLLEDGKSYTIEQVNMLIEKFMKGAVK